MKMLLGMSAVAALLATSPAVAQNAAYPTPDNNLTRSDDVDPSEAPYLNEEQGRPSTSPDYAVVPEDRDVDDGSDGASSGEAGADYPPPLPPGYHHAPRD